MQIKLKLGTWNQFNRYVICKWDSQIKFRDERKSYVNHRFLPVFSHIAHHNMMADTHRCSRVNHKNIWNWEIHVLFKILLFMLIYCSFYYNLWKMSFLFRTMIWGCFQSRLAMNMRWEITPKGQRVSEPPVLLQRLAYSSSRFCYK